MNARFDAAWRTASVDRSFFQATADALSRRGLRLEALCAEHRIANPLDAAGERVPLEAVSQVYRAAALATQDPAFVYLQPEQSAHEQSSVLFALVMCCETPAQMARMICRYSAIVSDAVRYELRDEGVRLHIRVVPNERVFVSLHQVEVALWFLVLWVRRLQAAIGARLAWRVALAHAPLFDEVRYAQLYGTPPCFGAPCNELLLSGDGLARPVAGHDQRLLAYYRAQAERYEGATLAEGEFPRRAAILLSQRLAFGRPDARAIAEQLNVSVRTLQRRLKEAGSSWTRVADEARRMVAVRELTQSARPLAEIAMLTGFADARAFIRAFQRWTGTTPAQYRRGAGDQSAAG